MGSDSHRHGFGRRTPVGQDIEYTECVGRDENPEALGTQEVEHGSGSEVELQQDKTLEQAGDDGHGSCSTRSQRNRVGAPHEQRRGAGDVAGGGDSREAGQQRFEGDARLEAREARADAEVRSEPER